MEKGRGEKSALAELAGEFGIDAFAIVTLDDVIAHLHGRMIDGAVAIDDATAGKDCGVPSPLRRGGVTGMPCEE